MPSERAVSGSTAGGARSGRAPSASYGKQRCRWASLHLMSDMTIYEALYTTRAMRRIKKDPIPEDVKARILDAAIQPR